MIEQIGHWMLVTARQFIIDHKFIFKTAIIAFAKILPEPIPESLDYPNSFILLRIRDKFFKYCNYPPMTQELYQAAWKIFICEMEHDPDHRAMVQFILEEITESIMNGEWKPREIGWPTSRNWKEPRTASAGNYGGYHGYNFAKYIQRKE